MGFCLSHIHVLHVRGSVIQQKVQIGRVCMLVVSIILWYDSAADENSTDASIGGENVCYHPCFVVGYGFKQVLMSELY